MGGRSQRLRRSDYRLRVNVPEWRSATVPSAPTQYICLDLRLDVISLIANVAVFYPSRTCSQKHAILEHDFRNHFCVCA